MAKNIYRTFIRENQIEQELKEIEEAAQKEADTPNSEDTPAKNPEEETFKKRYSDLRSHAQKKENEYLSEIKALRDQMADLSKKELKLPKTEEEVQEWIAKYPDLAAIFETIVIKKVKEDREDIDKEFKKLSEDRLSHAERVAYETFLDAHPDFASIKDSDEFQIWIREQPKFIWNALYENETDASAAIRAVDLYKADKNIKKAPKSDTRDAARSTKVPSSATAPANGNKPKFTEKMVAMMSTREYEKYAEEIDEAMKDPSFYDISGGAR